MDHTKYLLQSLVENARMGEDACDQLVKRAEDKEIRNQLLSLQQQYAEAAKNAEQRLMSLGGKPEPKGMMARMGMWMGMQFNTALDQSAGHIAEIAIQGADMGIVEITKALNSYPQADGESRGIANAMVAFQQQAADAMKAFLRADAVVK